MVSKIVMFSLMLTLRVQQLSRLVIMLLTAQQLKILLEPESHGHLAILQQLPLVITRLQDAHLNLSHSLCHINYQLLALMLLMAVLHYIP